MTIYYSVDKTGGAKTISVIPAFVVLKVQEFNPKSTLPQPVKTSTYGPGLTAKLTDNLKSHEAARKPIETAHRQQETERSAWQYSTTRVPKSWASL